MGNVCTAACLEQFELLEEGNKQEIQVGEKKVPEQAADDALGKRTEIEQETTDTNDSAAAKVDEVVADVKDAAEVSAETVSPIPEVAAEAVACTMVVEFGICKGKTRIIEFTNKDTGFTTGPLAVGCCVSAAKTPLVVTKVDKGKQADELGVKKSWTVIKVNGAEVSSIDVGKELLADALDKFDQVVLPKKATTLDSAMSGDSVGGSTTGGTSATGSSSSSETSAAQRWRRAALVVRLAVDKPLPEARRDRTVLDRTRTLLRRLTRRSSRIPTTATEAEGIRQLTDTLLPGGALAGLSDFAKEYGDESFCRRLLRKYDGNVNKAKDKLRQALIWREQNQQVIQTRRFVQGGDYRPIGADTRQRPVLYMCMKNQLLPGGQCLDHQIVATLQAIDNMPQGVEKATHVWDLHGMSIRQNLNPAPLGQMLQAAEGYFAERMQELVIIDMPRMASFLKDAIWPLVPEKTRNKVRFLTAEEAKEHFRATLLPDTADRMLASMAQNRDAKVSLEERKKSWMRVNEAGDVIPAFA